MWGYIIAINPKRSKNKLLKASSLLDFHFMIILTRTMFKNTYTDIEVKKMFSSLQNQPTKWLSKFRVYTILPESKLYEKMIIFITQDKLFETCFLLKTYRFTQRLYPSLFNNISKFWARFSGSFWYVCIIWK